MSATAWRLHSPSASGGKVYDILLVDRYVLVGYGSMSGTMQYKVSRFVHPEEARAFAVVQTEGKERRGYKLDGTVHVAPRPPRDYIDVLAARGGHRGASTAFDLWFFEAYGQGSKLT